MGCESEYDTHVLDSITDFFQKQAGGGGDGRFGTKHFRRLLCLAKNVIGFCLWRSPFSGHFRGSLNLGRRRSFSAMQDSAYLMPHPRVRPSAPASRGSSKASTPTALASTPPDESAKEVVARSRKFARNRETLRATGTGKVPHRLFLDRVARQQSPSPLHRYCDHKTLDGRKKTDITERYCASFPLFSREEFSLLSAFIGVYRRPMPFGFCLLLT